MSEARDRVEAGSQEAALLASARRIAEARPSGGWACHIRLSQVPRQRLQENSSFAVNILRSAVERCLGRLFLLARGDLEAEKALAAAVVAAVAALVLFHLAEWAERSVNARMA